VSYLAFEIRPIAEADLALVEAAFPADDAAKHAERLARQRRGLAAYLIAWVEGRPAGHVLVKWGGSTDERVARQLRAAQDSRSPCPDIEDLWVLPELRSRGIGGRLLGAAERLAMERKYQQVGLSVAAGNPSARRLYERLGYADAGFGDYVERGVAVDAQGRRHIWEETCVYLIKELER